MAVYNLTQKNRDAVSSYVGSSGLGGFPSFWNMFIEIVILLGSTELEMGSNYLSGDSKGSVTVNNELPGRLSGYFVSEL